MLPHPLTNHEIMQYYQNEPRFISIFSRDWCFIIIHKRWGVGGILLNWMNMKILVLIASNIYHVQATNSVCGYFCILLNLCLRVKHYMII